MKSGMLLEPLEKHIAEIILQHPEYHTLLEKGEDSLDKDYTPEQGQTNPFLHLGMHLALREQVGTDRPAGIAGLTRSLLARHHGDGHTVEHMMMECLGEMLWTAQRQNSPPDEAAYLDCIKKL